MRYLPLTISLALLILVIPHQVQAGKVIIFDGVFDGDLAQSLLALEGSEIVGWILMWLGV